MTLGRVSADPSRLMAPTAPIDTSGYRLPSIDGADWQLPSWEDAGAHLQSRQITRNLLTWQLVSDNVGL